MIKELTQATIEQWVALAGGTFNVKDIWSELNIITPEGKHHLRVILNRLEEKKLISKTRKDGIYRPVDGMAKEIEWENVDSQNVYPLLLPFSIHEYCKLYPKSIVIITADKNQGKTAFLYKLLELNAGVSLPDKEGNRSIDLFNSETSPEQMKDRFGVLELPRPIPFKVYERYDNFADVIHPEHLTLIDYLDMNSEVYLIGDEIDKVFRKLTTGCAVIALQKPAPFTTMVKGKKVIQSRDLAYGGSFSAKRAMLYITMSQQKLKLLYVKTPANPRVNPDNMMWSYEFDEYGYFKNIRRYYGEDNQPEDLIYRGGN